MGETFITPRPPPAPCRPIARPGISLGSGKRSADDVDTVARAGFRQRGDHRRRRLDLRRQPGGERRLAHLADHVLQVATGRDRQAARAFGGDSTRKECGTPSAPALSSPAGALPESLPSMWIPHRPFEDVEHLVFVAVDVQRRKLAVRHVMLDHADTVVACIPREADIHQRAPEPEQFRRDSPSSCAWSSWSPSKFSAWIGVGRRCNRSTASGTGIVSAA